MQSSVPINRPPCSIDSSQLRRCGERAVGTTIFPGSSTRPLYIFDAAFSCGAAQSAKNKALLQQPTVHKETIDGSTRPKDTSKAQTQQPPAMPPSTLYVDFPHPSGRLSLQQQQKRRCVRFAPHLHEERDHVARVDMSQSEVLACWYDESDPRELQAETIATVREIRRLRAEAKPAFLGRVDYRGCLERELDRRGLLSPRGLEHVVDPIVLAQRKAVQDAVVGAVLTEQEAGRILTEERGLRVPRTDELIAQASAEASRTSAEWAAAVALEDASAAREIARESDDGNWKKRLVDLCLLSTF